MLIALKRSGSLSIAQLADELELTGEAVRQQLLQLQRDGWIEARSTPKSGERARTGRPAAFYALTDAGDHLFPKKYDALNVLVIDAVTDELGEEATERVLRRIYEQRVAASEPSLRGLSLDAKVRALEALYAPDDPYMEMASADDGFRLIERNCPFFNTAMRRPALCSVSVNTLTKLLGVRVAREERFQSGDGRCVFRVYAQQPIDADAWQFRLEDLPSS